jgi:Vitamin K-dependent gamma-carboxylase
MADTRVEVPRGMLERLEAYSGREQLLIGASVWRLVAGATMLIEYLLNYAQRRYLHGPESPFPFDVFSQTRPYSIYAWGSSPLYFEVCFHLGILFATLWLVGWRTRWVAPVNFMFWWSLQQRFPGLWDGGDNIMRLVLIYSMFANTSAYFSMDASRRRQKPPRSRPTLEKTAAMLHNAAMLAFAIQLGVMYGVAGLTKVQGEMWREGTALYYALRGGQYVWPGKSEWLYRNGPLMAFVSQTTVLFQISFPFMLFMNRYMRLLVILISICFHVSIALFMGLITFSLYMMAVDLALIGDDEYRLMGRGLQRLAERVRGWVLPQAPAAPAPVADGPQAPPTSPASEEPSQVQS